MTFLRSLTYAWKNVFGLQGQDLALSLSTALPEFLWLLFYVIIMHFPLFCYYKKMNFTWDISSWLNILDTDKKKLEMSMAFSGFYEFPWTFWCCEGHHHWKVHAKANNSCLFFTMYTQYIVYSRGFWTGVKGGLYDYSEKNSAHFTKNMILIKITRIWWTWTDK